VCLLHGTSLIFIIQVKFSFQMIAPGLGRILADLSPQMFEFGFFQRCFKVGFLGEKVLLGHFYFSEYFGFYCLYNFHLWPVFIFVHRFSFQKEKWMNYGNLEE